MDAECQTNTDFKTIYSLNCSTRRTNALFLSIENTLGHLISQQKRESFDIFCQLERLGHKYASIIGPFQVEISQQNQLSTKWILCRRCAANKI